MANQPSQPAFNLPTLPPLERPYLDSSVFLAHIKGERTPSRGTTRIAITTGLLEGAEQRRYQLFTSFLTWAEVRRLREARKELTPDELPMVNGLFTRFLENGWLTPIEVSRLVGEKAQELGATYGMVPRTPYILLRLSSPAATFSWFGTRVASRTYLKTRPLKV